MKTCIVCHSKIFDKLFDVDEFEIIKCGSCGLVKTKDGQKSSYDKYHGDEAYRVFETHFRNIYQKRANMILKFLAKRQSTPDQKKEPRRVLDIGASTGTMLAIFKDAGWGVWGVEPSRSGKTAIEKDIKILRTTFEKARLPKDYFDVVILNHTLEHLINPVTVLKKARTVLKKRGIVFVDVPNFGSLSARILGKRWPFILPAEHIFHFTPVTLQKVFRKAGFKTVRWQTQSGVFECANPFFEIIQSLVTFKKRFFTNFLGLPFAFIATAVNKGASLSMIGEKTK